MIKLAAALRVAQVGIYPPPYGGVSIHIQRLHAFCLAQNIKSTVFDISRQAKRARNVMNVKRFWNWPRLLASRQDIIHVHTTSRHWVSTAVFFCLARLKGARFVLTYHSLRYSRGDFGPLGRRVMKALLSSAEWCIAVSPQVKDGLIALGARADRISVVPAYLPPVIKDEEIAEIPPAVWEFMAAHKPVISANAFNNIKYHGEDLYGIDMCIELCAALKDVFPGVGVVFCLPNIGDREYFAELKRRITEKDISNNFLFQTKPCQFYPVLMKSDIFVRPTSSDGDAVSLREALYLEIPSAASDAATRPEGTVIFKNRDVSDFIASVKKVWENYADYKKKAASLKMPDIMGEILAIYLRAVSGE